MAARITSGLKGIIMGDDESVAVPIRYMAVNRSWLGRTKFAVLDTSVEGQGRTVAKCGKLEDALMIMDAMNALFGHPQGSGI